MAAGDYNARDSDRRPEMTEARELVSRSESELERDHRRIRHLLDVLQAATEMTILGNALAELDESLKAHFAREEGAGGLFESLAHAAPELTPQLQALQAEHARLAAEVERLRRTAAQPGMGYIAVRAASTTVIEALRRHEQLEHEVTERASVQSKATSAGE